jgi:probable F420-dependent oxidoreductase
VRTWLSAAFVPPTRLIELAVAAENAGIYGISFPDHVCTPQRIDTPYPYTADGKATISAGEAFADPVAASTSLGAATSELRFVTHVMIVPLRNPLLLAKEIATAAVLTRGRFELGIGSGWMREEYDALDVSFGDRGRRLDEALDVMRALWSGDSVEHDGDFFRFAKLGQRPALPSPMPIVVGGHSKAALRRAARVGDAWAGIHPSVEDVAHLLDQLHEERRQAGTLDRPLELRTGTKGRLRPERIKELDRLGITSLYVGLWQVIPDAPSIYEIDIDEVIDRLPKLTELINDATA